MISNLTVCRVSVRVRVRVRVYPKSSFVAVAAAMLEYKETNTLSSYSVVFSFLCISQMYVYDQRPLNSELGL